MPNLNEELKIELNKDLKKINEAEEFSLTDDEQINMLQDFLDGDDVDGLEQIVDLDAEDEDELKDSYVGDIIIECPTCHTKYYKKEEDVFPSEDDVDLVNVEEECPHCQATGGYHIVGKVAPVEDVDIEDTKVDIDNDEVDIESDKVDIKDNKKKREVPELDESLFYGVDEVNFIDDENGKKLIFNGKIYNYSDTLDRLWKLFNKEVNDGNVKVDYDSWQAQDFPREAAEDFAFEQWVYENPEVLYGIFDTIDEEDKNETLKESIDDDEMYDITSLDGLIVKLNDTKDKYMVVDLRDMGTTFDMEDEDKYISKKSIIKDLGNVLVVDEKVKFKDLTAPNTSEIMTMKEAKDYFDIKDKKECKECLSAKGKAYLKSLRENKKAKTSKHKECLSKKGKEYLKSLHENKQVKSKKSIKERMSNNSQDIKIDNFDEKLFENLTTQYLKKVYDNVKSFNATSGRLYDKNSRIIIEGNINFKSGKTKNTKFVFEALGITKRGNVKFKGLNEGLTSSKTPFTLSARVENNTLLCESMIYNYSAKNGNKSTRVYGRVVYKK